MRHLGMGLESQDDEIIDLEDIIEMPAGPIDEDEDLDLDIDILDEDSYHEPEPEKPSKKAARPLMKEQAQERPSEQEDMFKLFGDEPEEDEALFEPVASRAPSRKPMERAEPKLLDKEDESILDEFLDEPGMPEPGISAKESIDLGEMAAAATELAEEARSARIEAEPAVSDESLDSVPSQPAAPGPAPIPPPADISQIAEELIGRLESRLQEHIQVMVESRLPGLLRSIIAEELEKLKKELE
ncbi:MAG: hypothetical protein ABSG91_07130 [Syntrophobacteraceae bacterium]